MAAAAHGRLDVKEDFEDVKDEMKNILNTFGSFHFPSVVKSCSTKSFIVVRTIPVLWNFLQLIRNANNCTSQRAVKFLTDAIVNLCVVHWNLYIYALRRASERTGACSNYSFKQAANGRYRFSLRSHAVRALNKILSKELNRILHVGKIKNKSFVEKGYVKIKGKLLWERERYETWKDRRPCLE